MYIDVPPSPKGYGFWAVFGLKMSQPVRFLGNHMRLFYLNVFITFSSGFSPSNKNESNLAYFNTLIRKRPGLKMGGMENDCLVWNRVRIWKKKFQEKKNLLPGAPFTIRKFTTKQHANAPNNTTQRTKQFMSGERTLYEHQQAKSTFQSWRCSSTFPAAWAKSQPTTQPWITIRQYMLGD